MAAVDTALGAAGPVAVGDYSPPPSVLLSVSTEAGDSNYEPLITTPLGVEPSIMTAGLLFSYAQELRVFSKMLADSYAHYDIFYCGSIKGGGGARDSCKKLIDEDKTPASMAGPGAAKVYVRIERKTTASGKGIAAPGPIVALDADAGAGSQDTRVAAVTERYERIIAHYEVLRRSLTSETSLTSEHDDMRYVTSEDLASKEMQYDKLAPHTVADAPACKEAPRFNWSEAASKGKATFADHPSLLPLLNATLEPAGFSALLPRYSFRERTYYNGQYSELYHVEGMPDGYILVIDEYLRHNLGQGLRVGAELSGRPIAVVMWGKPADMRNEDAYAQLCMQVFALGERRSALGERTKESALKVPVIGLLTDQSTCAALFSVDPLKGTCQRFVSEHPVSATHPYLLPLDAAMGELVRWLQKTHPEGAED